MNDSLSSDSSIAIREESDVVIDFAPPGSTGSLGLRLLGAGPDRDSRSQRLHPRILLATSFVPPELLRGLARAAREEGWRLITDMLHTGQLPRCEIDGIVACAPDFAEIAAYAYSRDLPCVAIDLADTRPPIPSVRFDNYAIGRLAARHLASRGCRCFAWAPLGAGAQHHERLAGFRSITSPQGYACYQLQPLRPNGAVGSLADYEDWRASVLDTLGSLPRRTGVFAYNDSLAAELLQLALEAGRSVPDEVAILGFGNASIDCDTALIALSSIDPDYETLAYRAAMLLASALKGERLDRHARHIPPAGLIARDSTAFSQRDHSRLTQARSFIAERFADPSLSVSAVAEQLGLSRRQLEREFRGAKGCTVREYIEETRLAEAARLLLAQPMTKISCIATMVGISATGNFFRIFRKRFGMTPSAYRERFLQRSPHEDEPNC